ncbi:hypothetical protein BDW72DRAFT_185785, partial [Aspergillus terricola var. indicus]
MRYRPRVAQDCVPERTMLRKTIGLFSRAMVVGVLVSGTVLRFGVVFHRSCMRFVRAI